MATVTDSKLVAACRKRNVDEVEELLKKPGTDVNATGKGFNEKQQTPLFLASSLGMSKVVSMLLSHPDTDPDKCVMDDSTRQLMSPLYIAARNGFSNVVDLLITHNASISIPGAKVHSQ